MKKFLVPIFALILVGCEPSVTVQKGKPPTDGSSGNPNKITSVTMGWNKSAGATGYIIQGGPVGGGASLVAKTTATQYRFTGLKVGTTYGFRVAATNYAGSAPLSAQVTWLAVRW